MVKGGDGCLFTVADTHVYEVDEAHTADVNGDGTLDLVDSRNVYLAEETRLAAPRVFPTDVAPRESRLVDMDLDGDPDLVMFARDSEGWWAVVLTSTGDGMAESERVRIADDDVQLASFGVAVRQGGRPHLLMRGYVFGADPQAPPTRFFRTFCATQGSAYSKCFEDAPDYISPHFTLLTTADVTGDGIEDIIELGGGIQIMAGHADGSFTTVAGPPLPGGYGSLTAVQVDAQGPTDLVYLTEDVAYTYLMKQGGIAQQPVVTALPFSLTDVDSTLVADMDGDGIPDIVGNTSEGVQVIHGRASGRFDSPMSLASTADVHAVGDVNLDGVPDLVSQDGVHLQSPDGLLSELHPMDLYGELVDWNGDGALDFLWHGSGDPTLILARP